MADLAHIESISSIENLRYRVSVGVNQVCASLRLVFNSIDHERTASDSYLSKGRAIVEKWAARTASAWAHAEAIRRELDNLPPNDERHDYSRQRAVLVNEYEVAMHDAEKYAAKRDAAATITEQIADSIRQIGAECDTLSSYTIRAESDVDNQGRSAVSAVDRVIVVVRQYIARRIEK